MKKNIQKYYHPSTTQHNIHADSKIPRAIKWSTMKADESALLVYLLTLVYGHNYIGTAILFIIFVHSFVCLNVN